MNKLIAVVGMTGSGKSVITDYLEKNGFKKVYFGGLTYEKMKQDSLQLAKGFRSLIMEPEIITYSRLFMPEMKEDSFKNSLWPMSMNRTSSR